MKKHMPIAIVVVVSAAFVAGMMILGCSQAARMPAKGDEKSAEKSPEPPGAGNEEFAKDAADRPSRTTRYYETDDFSKTTHAGRVGWRREGATYAGRGVAYDAEAARRKLLAGLDAYDELWVIERPPAQPVADEGPGTGAMMATVPGEEKEVPLPLKHTDVKGRICGYIATVDVTQQFHNPYDEKIEAVYLFPLPQNAAVNEFVMVVGARRIRGIIREREEAEKIYAEARRQGHVASLLTQERANIFTQKVANIEPGKEIDVEIRYFQTLSYADGWYEFVFPMVVGPRFNPPGSTTGVGAVGRGSGGASGQKTEVEYLKPGERSGHDISLALELEPGVEVEELECPSHVIRRSVRKGEEAVDRLKRALGGDDRTGGEIGDAIRVQIAPLDAIPNKDFVLRWKVAGDSVKSALMTHRDERGTFFTLMLVPPADLKNLKRAPMEMIFVLDCSGSMSGYPIAKAKAAAERALRNLEPDDTFQIIQFSINASKLGPKPIPATPENVRKGLAYLKSLEGEGGTMMIEGIKAALDFPHDERRLRVVSFMTDGYIGNEAQILGEVKRRVKSARIFSFGVGSSPNRYLIERMAKIGRGAVAYVGSDAGAGRAVDAFYERVSHPAMSDIQINWGGLAVSDVYPAEIPDLFVGRPVIITGRLKGDAAGAASIRVLGRAGGRDISLDVPVDFAGKSADHPGLAAVWARMKIADLADRATWVTDPQEMAEEIKQVALDYGLMSSFTAFVAVDSLTVTAGTHGTTVVQPVPVPEGVKYETTVSE